MSLPTRERGDVGIVVFGGSFDPMHVGHVQAIRRLCARFPQVIVAPTSQNPWKSGASATFDERLEMIRRVLTHESLNFVETFRPNAPLVLEHHPYTFAKDFVVYLRSLTAREVTWAVGEDAADEPVRWKDWDRLGVAVITVPIEIDTHATDVRKGAACAHPAIRQFIRERGLYQADASAEDS